MNNNRGSVTVWAMVLFPSLVLLIFAFTAGARQLLVTTEAKELSLLWCDNILAEYDIPLQEEYNLFGFYGMPNDISEKLDFYAEDAFSKKKNVDIGRTSVELYPYSLNDPEVLKKQITAVGKLTAADKLAEKAIEKAVPASEDLETASELSDSLSEEAFEEKASALKEAEENEAEKTEKYMKDLPSEGMGEGFSLASLKDSFQDLKSPKDFLKKGSDEFLEAAYRNAYFNDMVERPNDKSVLKYEEEYMVFGGGSDAENKRKMMLAVGAIREAANLVYLEKNPEAHERIASAVAAAGPAAPVLEHAALVFWAGIESRNDWLLLMHGKKVPIMKTRSTWAVDFPKDTEKSVPKADTENSGPAANGRSQNTERPGEKTGTEEEYDTDAAKKSTKEVFDELTYVDMDNPTGLTYQEYLEFFLHMTGENLRYLRMMDLIQMNMQKNNYSEFRLADYSAGLKADFSVNGRSFSMERSYEED